MELKDYVRMVLSHWAGVVLLAVLGVVAGVGFNAAQPEVYQASAHRSGHGRQDHQHLRRDRR
jgi:uncharacterized protein involved in exopolysaccharide biosynthesis